MSDPIFESLENDPDLELGDSVHKLVSVLNTAVVDLSNLSEYMATRNKRVTFNQRFVTVTANAFARSSDLVTELYEENHVLREKLEELRKELETLRRKS